MLLHVPVSLDGLLSLLAPCFTQPTFQTFRALLVGQVSQTGRRTVCGMLIGARLSAVWEHSRAHRFFSRARWQPDQLGLAVAGLIVERFHAEGQPVTVAIRHDTLLQRWGRKVFWLLLPITTRPPTARRRRSRGGTTGWSLGSASRCRSLSGTVCLPVLFRLWRPRRGEYAKIDKPDPERPRQARDGTADDRPARRPPARPSDRCRRRRRVRHRGVARTAWSGDGHLPPRANAAIYRARAGADGQARPAPQMGQADSESLPRSRSNPTANWAEHTVCRYGNTETLHAARHRLPVGAAGP